MFNEKVHAIISSFILVCLSFLFVPISSTASAATEEITEPQDIIIEATSPAAAKEISAITIETQMEYLDNAVKSLPKKPIKSLPLIDPIPKKVTSKELTKESTEESMEESMEDVSADTPYESYKKRADNWEMKDVANNEPITTLTAEEINLIERLVESELTGYSQELYYGKLAIANVILNRYRTDYWEFPDTIKEVVYQKNQFTSAFNGRIDKITVTELTKTVVKDALSGVMVVEPDVYFFCTLDASRKEWFENNLNFYGHFSSHDFYSLK